MASVKIKDRDIEFNVGKIVCVGRNYAEHAQELGHKLPEKPLIFLKPASDIIHSGDQVIHPPYSEDLQHEVELVLLIGRQIRMASLAEAEDAIAGYGVGLDMTLRDLQFQQMKNGDPWTLSKCFDTSAVLSDFVLKEDYALTMEERITLSVNGKIRQSSVLKNMIFKPARLAEYISSVMTLQPGDLIYTGTPEGVGRVRPGDIIEAEIEDIAGLHTEVIV
ncbi:MAG: fumarylacetoacetate hydrolase family protein [Bacteroidota bacterium]